MQPQPFAPALPPPQVSGGVHVSGQVIDWPQLFVAGPHARPAQAVVLSGVQHVPFDRHTPAFGHVLEQVTDWPQLSVVVVLHRPAQAVVSSGVQQVVPVQMSLDELQLTVPPLPHGTIWPQLFMTAPQVAPLHVVATGSGTQPQAPLLQTAPASQSGHVTFWPQLSCTPWQRFAHQVESGCGVQHVELLVQTPPSPQPPHVALWPQLSVAVVLHLPAQAATSSGAQHVPSDWQIAPPAHVVVPL